MNVDTDTQYAFTRPVADHMLKHYDGVLKIDGEVGNKKFYDPRAWGKSAETGMADRVVEACENLRSAGTPACAEAMAAVLAEHASGEAYLPLRSVMIPPGAAGFMGLMPGWRGPQAGTDAAFGMKAVCIVPANPARGLDAHQGIVTLFDGETGVPTAILDAAAITEIRTAAVSAVATSALARPDARILAILGAGTQARAHLRALTLDGRRRSGARVLAHRGPRPRAHGVGRYSRRRAAGRQERPGGARGRRCRGDRDQLT